MRTSSVGPRLIVPAYTSSPGATSCGTDSPVSSALSISERPSVTIPSPASASPWRTSMIMPGTSASDGTSRTSPFSITRAMDGDSACSSSAESTAARCARVCRKRPHSSRKTSVVTPSK